MSLSVSSEKPSLVRPSTIVTTLDPGIERAILRCLEPDPDRRPASALAVSAALPGGDPLAAALAAGETPSPEMVAAAGEGAGLRARVAWPLWAAIVAGIAVSFVMGLRTSPLDKMRPEYTAEVLAQKARDAIRQLVSPERSADEAFGFRWNEELVSHIQETDKPAPRWETVFAQRPSAARVLVSTESRRPHGPDVSHRPADPGGVWPDDPPPISRA